MTNKFMKILSASLALTLCASSAYAKDSMFGERDEWLVAQDYIDGVYKYDYETVEDTADDTKGEDLGSFSRAINDCILLGIMSNEESGNFEANKIVTKNYLASVIMNMLYNSDAVVSDYIKQYSGDDDAKVSDAAAVMVEALGYGDMMGAYAENGAMLAAAKLKIFKNTDLPSGNAPLTKGVLAQLVYNTVNIDIRVESGFVNNEASYERKKGSTILTEYLNATSIDGFLDGVYGVSVYTNNKIDEGYVSIDRVQYMTDGNYISLFGKRVHGYARYDELRKKYRIIGLTADDESKASVTYYLDDCYVDGGSIKADTADGKTEKYSVSSVKHFLYNGDFKTVKELASVLSNTSNGTITFSASENNSDYDTVIVKEFNSYALQSASAEDNMFVLKNGAVYNGKGYVRFDDGAALYVTDAAGNSLSLSDAKANNVLDFYQNSDGSFGEAIITTTSVAATIAATEDDKYIFDNGVSARLSEACKTAINKGKLKTPSVGDEGDYYISFCNEIVDYSAGSEAAWAYLREIGTVGNSAFSTGCAMKIFTADSTWKKLDFADKIEIDGVKNIEVDDAYGILAAKNCTDNLIRYKCNSDGKVTFLDTIAEDGAEAGDNERVSLAANFNGKANWSSGYSWTDCPLHIVPTTELFIVPDDRTKEKKYSIDSNKYFKQDEKYNVDFYSPDNMLKCAAAVVHGDGGGSTGNFVGSTLFAVESVIRGIEDDEEVTMIKGWNWKNSVSSTSMAVSQDLMEDEGKVKPKVGCVYRYKLSGGQISELELVADNGVARDFAENTGAAYEKMCGTVLDCEPNYMKIEVNGTEWVWDVTTASYVFYDTTTGKFKKIAASDICNGDRAVIIGAVEYGGAVLIIR